MSLRPLPRQEGHKPGGVAIVVRSACAPDGRGCWPRAWSPSQRLRPHAHHRARGGPQSTATDEQIEAMLGESEARTVRDYALLCLLVDTGLPPRRTGRRGAGRRGPPQRPGHVPGVEDQGRVAVPLTDRAVVAIHRWMKQRGVGQGPLWGVSDPYSLINAVAASLGGRAALHTRCAGPSPANGWPAAAPRLGLERIGGWSSLAMVRTYVRARRRRPRQRRVQAPDVLGRGRRSGPRGPCRRRPPRWPRCTGQARPCARWAGAG